MTSQMRLLRFPVKPKVPPFTEQAEVTDFWGSGQTAAEDEWSDA
jgi:hypothetical protein